MIYSMRPSDCHIICDPSKFWFRNSNHFRVPWSYLEISDDVKSILVLAIIHLEISTDFISAQVNLNSVNIYKCMIAGNDLSTSSEISRRDFRS